MCLYYYSFFLFNLLKCSNHTLWFDFLIWFIHRLISLHVEQMYPYARNLAPWTAASPPAFYVARLQAGLKVASLSWFGIIHTASPQGGLHKILEIVFDRRISIHHNNPLNRKAEGFKRELSVPSDLLLVLKVVKNWQIIKGPSSTLLHLIKQSHKNVVNLHRICSSTALKS